MKNFIYAAACLCMIYSHTIVRAQEAAQPLTGVYQTRSGEHLLATESYRVTRKPDGALAAEAEITPASGGAKRKLITSAAKTRPESFVIEIEGERALEAKLGANGAFKLNVAGRPAREVQSKATVVMENLVWHQFVFLLAQYDHARGGRQEFTAFLPSQGVDYTISLEYVAAQTYKPKDGAAVATHRYKVIAAGAVALDLWTDEARVPLLLQVEAQKIKVVRQGAEALAEAAFAPPVEYRAPAYVAPASFTERELIVDAGQGWPLPATLSLPAGKGTFPAVVLVHGSGPNDRDETLGAGNKPFRDLAWGLASRGVAVLRYDKRTHHHADKLGRLLNFTVREETIEDVLAAVRLLRATAGVDTKRIYVLGHSLGGMLVPRIGAADAQIAGFVLLAAPARPLEDAFARQYEYGAMLDGRIDEAERARIEDVKRQAARIKQLKANDAATTSGTLLFAPPSYWLDLQGYDPPRAARALKRPMLILQGERDFNVTLDDLRLWQTALAAQKEVEFKTYPKLDHLFYEGEGRASGADYERPRNIPAYVVEEIAAWIKRR
ncbi:MAG TPA: alpha/beta fold hydrolase [Pyrinomonadaceae bacterium]|nr:alpha/beta fold hydrolase [Pyrinomonadaceae bacterium]